MDSAETKISKAYSIGNLKGTDSGSGSINWRTAPLDVVAEFSPQVAWARFLGIPFAPFVQTISATFQNATDTLGPVSFPTNSRISVVSIVDQIVLHVDAPNLNAGNALKPFIDWFFARQSGIQATLQINNAGPSSYVITPQFVPVDELCAMITEGWPSGWILNYTQAPQMSFTTGFALPSLPVTVTCAFRMWQPTRIRSLIQMSDHSAAEKLLAEGIITQAQAERMFQSY